MSKLKTLLKQSTSYQALWFGPSLGAKTLTSMQSLIAGLRALLHKEVIKVEDN